MTLFRVTTATVTLFRVTTASVHLTLSIKIGAVPSLNGKIYIFSRSALAQYCFSFT